MSRSTWRRCTPSYRPGETPLLETRAGGTAAAWRSSLCRRGNTVSLTIRPGRGGRYWWEVEFGHLRLTGDALSLFAAMSETRMRAMRPLCFGYKLAPPPASVTLLPSRRFRDRPNALAKLLALNPPKPTGCQGVDYCGIM